jgi:hypothetical protein
MCRRSVSSAKRMPLLKSAYVLFNGILTVGTGCYMANGIYKIKNGWGTEDLIRVRDEDGREMDMPRRLYEEEGYRPSVRELPEKDFNGNP